MATIPRMTHDERVAAAREGARLARAARDAWKGDEDGPLSRDVYELLRIAADRASDDLLVELECQRAAKTPA